MKAAQLKKIRKEEFELMIDRPQESTLEPEIFDQSDRTEMRIIEKEVWLAKHV